MTSAFYERHDRQKGWKESQLNIDALSVIISFI